MASGIHPNSISKKPRILAVFVLLITAVLLVGIKTDWPTWYWIALGTMSLAAIGWWIAARQGGLLGPHFFYDLIRLARRSRTRDMRMLYLLALLIGLGAVYWIRFPHQSFYNLIFNTGQPLRTNEMSRFAEVFVFTVIVVQNLAVLLLTPIYLGSAIAEEKERKTLDLLFATQMKDREIIFGKLFSRLVHLGAILLAGLPILSLAQLWGGIDFRILLANFFNTGLILLSVGSVSILVSVLCRKVVTAVMIIYGFVLPITFCLGLFSLGGQTSILGISQSAMMDSPGSIFIVLTGLAIFHGMIAFTCLLVALFSMRGQHGGDDFYNQPPSLAPARGKRTKVKPLLEEERPFSLKVDRLYDLPPIHNDPLFWKEMHVGLNKQVVWPLFFTLLGLSSAMVIMSFLSMQMQGGFQPWEERSHNMGTMVKVLSIGWGLFCCVTVAFRASSAIVGERQNNTLEAILTLPVIRREIMRTKWLGCFFRSWFLWVCLTTAVFLGTITTAIQVSGGMLLLSAVFVHAAFFCSFGLFLSVVSKTALSANGKMSLTLLLLLIVTALFGEVVDVSRTERFGELLGVGLNPVRTWWELGFSWRDFMDGTRAMDPKFESALIGMAFYLFLAILFWFLACWRFGKVK